MKSLSNDFSSDLHLYKARTPQGHASGDPKPPLMITKDEDLLQEVFKTMLQPRGTWLGAGVKLGIYFKMGWNIK